MPDQADCSTSATANLSTCGKGARPDIPHPKSSAQQTGTPVPSFSLPDSLSHHLRHVPDLVPSGFAAPLRHESDLLNAAITVAASGQR
jgi:hypothetical protein